MARITIECLRCGRRRRVERQATGECPRCEYVGWAHIADLSKDDRRSLRDVPVEQRRLHAVS